VFDRCVGNAMRKTVHGLRRQISRPGVRSGIGCAGCERATASATAHAIHTIGYLTTLHGVSEPPPQPRNQH